MEKITRNCRNSQTKHCLLKGVLTIPNGSKKIITFSFVSFLGAGVNFLLMPYLTHYLSPSDYGILSMFNSYVSILIPLIGLVASGVISVEYFKIKDKKEFASLFSSVQLIPLLPATLFLLLNLIFSKYIARFLQIPDDKSYWLAISVFIALVTIFTETLLIYLITEQRSKLYAVFSLGRLFIEVSLTIYFVAVRNMSWEGRLLSWLITNTFYFIVALIYFIRRGLLVKRITLKYINYGIAYGLPLILHTLGTFMVNQSDRIFITKMVSIHEAGIYNIGYQVGVIMLILVNAVSNFLTPYIYVRLEDLTPKHKQEIVRTSYKMVIISFLFFILISFVSPYIFSRFVDSSYESALEYVFWVALSYFFWGIYLFFSNYIFYAKETGFLAWISILNITLNVSLNYFLIHKYGAIGAAYATCISFLIFSIIIILKSIKLFPLPWTNFLANIE
jgi:O-antigen/teichoic acid export membrane protein